jgi:hypothetical protein
VSLFVLRVGFSPIQLGFGLLVKVEVLVLLGEVKSRVYISVLLHVGLGIFFPFISFFFSSFLRVLFTKFTIYCSHLSYGFC